MIGFYLTCAVGLCVSAPLLHGSSTAQPVAGWLVLLVVVPALWLLIGGTVLVVDELFEWVHNRPKQ